MNTLSKPVRVVLADDHSMVREALARILEDSGGITVIGQASNGHEAIDMVKTNQVDVVVLDYSMPELDAPSVIEKLLRKTPSVKILVLTVHENVQYAVRTIESGAHGYLIKSAAVEELVEAIRAVHEGEIYISRKVSQEVLQHLRQPKRQRIGVDALSQREFDVLRILGSGKSLQDCAKQMKISTSSASTYRARLLEKLNLEGTAELIRFALEHDLVG